MARPPPARRHAHQTPTRPRRDPLSTGPRGLRTGGRSPLRPASASASADALRAALPGVIPDPAALDPSAARAHQTLQQQTSRLTALVAELRKIAELEARPLEREDVDLAQVVEDAVADLAATTGRAFRPRRAGASTRWWCSAPSPPC